MENETGRKPARSRRYGKKWTPKFGPVAKLDFSGSAEYEKTAEL
jgi:hypothetical protein